MNEMNLLDVIIETERLILKPITLNYAEDIFKEFTWEITKYMYPKPFDNIQEINKLIEESIIKVKNEVSLYMVILDRNNNEFIGCTGWEIFDTSKPELWIWIKKSSHNKSFGLEAMTGLIEWTHENIKFDYLIYPACKNNIASRRLPEKNKGKIMGEEKSLGEAGNELDECIYWIYPKNKEE
jgi:RimJ/RimL family protein N-acetyltransferase